MNDQNSDAGAIEETTVIIEGETGETIITITEETATAQVQDSPASPASSASTAPSAEAAQAAPDAAAAADADADQSSPASDLPSSGPSALSAKDEAIYTVRLLTAVAVGTVVEGGDQLVTRLKAYEQQLQAQADDDDQGVVDEDEFDRLRYATIGLIFDTQNMIGRSLALTLRAAETSLDVTEKVTRPFRNFFLFRPITKRVDKRVEGMVEHGQDSLSRWIDLGRQIEPESRHLASMTYEEIVDEFITKLADNPELKALVAQQSLSLAAGVRDEMRERTVTSDNVLEDIARRILRRQPRPELAEPPPEVQRWAGITPEEFREIEHDHTDEQQPSSTK